MRRSMLLAIIMLLALALPPPSAMAASSTPGDGQPVVLPSAPTMGPQSTVSGTAIKFVAEYGKTSIFLRICADSPSFQMRSEAFGLWITEVFNRTDAAGGCSPSATSWWRLAYNIDPNPAQGYRIYATANDTMLPESEFMRRAARTDCVVTAYATGYCTPAAPALVSAPNADVNDPGSGASVQGTINVSGWAIDAGSWSGPGVDQVQLYDQSRLLGTASYGQARSDVASVFGDLRFASSGFAFSLNTTSLTNGSHTIQVRFHSTVSQNWTTIERSITVANGVVGFPLPLPPPTPTPPAKGWNVPFFYQGNSVWGGQKIGACASTIANVGCALTSLAMIFRSYGSSQDPGTLNACLGGDACLLNWRSGKIATCSGGKVQQESSATYRPSFSYERLSQELQSRPVILELSNSATGAMHFIVVISGQGGDPSRYVVHDPGRRGGERQSLSSTLNFWYNYNNFHLRPASLRLYRGTPARAMASAARASIPRLQAPAPSAGEQVSGAVEVYSSTDTDMVLELASQSAAGNVTDMRVWTDSHPSEIWQPVSPYVQVPLDSGAYVQFRDAAGNTSAAISATTPLNPGSQIEAPATSATVYLPLVQQ